VPESEKLEKVWRNCLPTVRPDQMGESATCAPVSENHYLDLGRPEGASVPVIETGSESSEIAFPQLMPY